MTYIVHYKLRGQLFWRRLRIKGDWIHDANERTGAPIAEPFRVFMTDVDERVEIPLAGTRFRFDRQRLEVTRRQAERESGVNLPVQSQT